MEKGGMNAMKSSRVLKLFLKIILVTFFFNLLNNPIFQSHIVGYFKGTWHSSTFSLIQDTGCVLANPFYRPSTFRINECVSCESITKIHRLHSTMYEEIDLNYLKRNHPIIITDAMNDWWYNTVDVFNITEIYLKEQWMLNYEPCNLSTNFDLPTHYIIDYLIIASQVVSNHWFLQWKNCDLRAAKTTRNFYKQPYFMRYHLPAPKMNWVSLSHKYKMNKYREINVETERLVQVMQLKGSIKIELFSKQQCRNFCSKIEDVLDESEILVFNSKLWGVQYQPLSDTTVTITTEND